MNEITLLEAIHMLRMHKSKRQRLVFKVTFDEGITHRSLWLVLEQCNEVLDLCGPGRRALPCFCL